MKRQRKCAGIYDTPTGKKEMFYFEDEDILYDEHGKKYKIYGTWPNTYVREEIEYEIWRIKERLYNS